MELQGNILELHDLETRTFKSPNTGEDVEKKKRVLLLDCSTYNRFGDPIENIVPITFMGRYAEGLENFPKGSEVKVTVTPKGWCVERDGDKHYGVTIRGFYVSLVNPTAQQNNN
jgi:hypothetical protein